MIVDDAGDEFKAKRKKHHKRTSKEEATKDQDERDAKILRDVLGGQSTANGQYELDRLQIQKNAEIESLRIMEGAKVQLAQTELQKQQLQQQQAAEERFSKIMEAQAKKDELFMQFMMKFGHVDALK